MPEQHWTRVFTLLRRELQEYRTSLVWTPLIIAAGFILAMSVSVLFADSISAMGELVTQLVQSQEASSSSNISIRIDSSAGDEPTLEYRIEQRQDQVGPGGGNIPGVQSSAPGTTSAPGGGAQPGSLNLLLNSVHNIFLLVLVLVCANFLLATLFSDRRDRSILFFKSMPVSEWEEVLTKFGVAMVAAPVLFIAASLLTQVACILLAMLLLWRMELDPFRLVLENLDFGQLLVGQLGGWVLMSLWIAPTYAWLLLASAGSRRSPFMLAAGPPLALLLGERIVWGSAYLPSLLSRHIPHYGGGTSAGFYWLGVQDLPGMTLGLLFAAAVLWGAVYLRRYRFEI